MYEYIFAQIRSEAEKRNLKDSTIDAYCNTIGYFLRTVNKDINALSTDDVDAFLTEKRLRGLAPQTYNHYHSSIRFFYTRILKMNWDDEDIPRMKLDRSLPTVLSREEMQRIILADGSALEIAAQARKEGVRSLRESGLHKVKIGVTSLEEVLAVTNE